MKKVALHGSYYGDNFGDTLFVIHFINWLNENEKNTISSIHLPFASDRVRKLVRVSEKRGIRSIIEADSLVFFGGGYLGEPPGKNKVWSYRLIIRHLSVALLAFLFKKPFIFIGVGAGPLTNKLARKLTVFLCNKSKKTVVRDIESKEYLIRYGVKENKLKVTADSILTLQSQNVDSTQSALIKNKINVEKKDACLLIGVHLPINKNDNDKLILLIKDLKKYCDEIGKYKLVVFNDFYKENYDYQAFTNIKDEFGEENVIGIDYNNPQQLIALINELNIVITTKLHCGIVANCLGKYTLSVSVHNKTKRLYKQLNLEERNVALKEYKSGYLFDMLNNFKMNKKEYNNIPDSIRILADENRKELNSFIRNY
ncbi:polysaccharide pyruvyl transferase family protein [Bacillus sp. CH30_1T]|uniref:polysaccharide pyruvyl transferase family protein n=1 Tax=Bacillus sp. CH30_1T TaxID=2604836 RepID=UPI0011EBA369|nr:polysaccharide pyruvyl transferase family protein [Bacillus sp. CH30_1T]KAA0565836.1 polysaccharide pyruvyl transferase family protein [Bacillus sp. CH30_1T]